MSYGWIMRDLEGYSVKTTALNALLIELIVKHAYTSLATKT